MDDENDNLNYEMETLDEDLKDEIETLLRLKEDFIEGKITYEDLIERVKQSLKTTGRYKVVLNDIVERIESGLDPTKN